jgi:hypothetical protein
MTHIDIQYRGVDQLVPCARNARTHSPEQIRQIAKSIKAFGFIDPVVIDAQGMIAAGHARVLAARELGLAEIPTIAVERLSEDQVGETGDRPRLGLVECCAKRNPAEQGARTLVCDLLVRSVGARLSRRTAKTVVCPLFRVVTVRPGQGLPGLRISKRRAPPSDN